MTSFKVFIYIYLLGGVTFVPLLLVIAFYLLSHEKKDDESGTLEEELLVKVESDFKGGDLDEMKGVNASKQGWVYVTRQFYPHQSDLDKTDDNEENEVDVAIPISDQVTRDKLKKKDKFYAVLKHGNLFLYKDSTPESGPQQVIVLKETFVTIWPRNVSNYINTPLPDGSLFTKKTCISIWKNGSAFLDANGCIQFRKGGPADNFYIYIENNTEKEDWYFALINATKLNFVDSESKRSSRNPALLADELANTAHFKTQDILYLIQILNSNEGQHSSRWFNALIGRLFLSLQQTDTLSNFLKEKIYKKLKKINKPGFLDDFSIERVDVGNSAPLITHPKFLDLTPEGLTKICFNLLYTGHLHMIIATKVNLNFGSRFKKREVTIQLSITVKKISGPLLVLIKPPPSNRIWYSFQSEPLIEIDVEPVVSTRQISYNMITNMIKSKFKEAIKESLVFPFMDDIVFFKTTNELFRGGIWSYDNSTNPDRGVNEGNNGKSNVEQNPKSIIQQNEKDISENITANVPESKGDIFSLDAEQDATSIVEKFSSQNDLNGSHQDINDEIVNTETSRFLDETNPTNVVSKKYFQTGIKKIGKWYKDQVSSVKDNENGEFSDPNLYSAPSELSSGSAIHEKEKSAKTSPASKNTGPEMISSRRAPRSKSSTLHTINTSAPTTVSEDLHSAGMFVHERTSSISSSITMPSPVVESHRRHEKKSAFNLQEGSPKSENTEPNSTLTNEAVNTSQFLHSTHTSETQKSKKRPPPPLPPRSTPYNNAT